MSHNGDLDLPKCKRKKCTDANAKETSEINNIVSAEEQISTIKNYYCNPPTGQQSCMFPD